MTEPGQRSEDHRSDHRITVALDTDEALDAVARAAELWGARWSRLGTGGRLELPVHAGVRRGFVAGRLKTEPERRGTRLVFEEEGSEYSLNHASVALLGFGGIGALTLIFWPLYPALLVIAPFGLVFTIVAWLVLASRLQSSGVEDFLRLVASGGRDPERDSDDEHPAGGSQS